MDRILRPRTIAVVAPVALFGLFGVFLMAALSAMPGAVAGDHRKDPWQGQPELTKGENKGYFVWSDGDGWHVRWMSRGKTHNFSGSVTADVAITSFDPVSRDAKDYIKQEGDRAIHFDARAKEGMDGFNFRPSPSSRNLTFDFRIDGSRARTDDVKLGQDKERPASVPFTIHRK